jgi:hypothetical protein
MATQSFIGKGKVYLSTGTNALTPIGNVSKLALTVAEDRQDLSNYETAGGGIIDTVSRIKSVSIGITANSFDAYNLSAALRGTTTANTGITAITAEAHAGITAGLIMLNRLPNPTASLVVTDGIATLTEGVDYLRTKSGIEILEGGTVTGSDSLTVAYTPLPDNLIEALTTGGQFFRMVFEGLNEARSGAPVIFEGFRVLLSPTKTVDLISDKFGELLLDGSLLQDTSKVGSGVSQYFRIRQATV